MSGAFKRMEWLPDTCPHCKRSTNRQGMEWFVWIERSELDLDAGVEDQLFECSMCHTLFRARWELASFKELKEVD